MDQDMTTTEALSIDTDSVELAQVESMEISNAEQIAEQDTEQVVEEVPVQKNEEDHTEESLYEKLLNTLTKRQREEQELANIKRINPDVDSLEGLGEEYAKLMQTGLVDAVTAYYATVGRATTFTPSDDGKSHLIKSGGAVGVPTGKDIPRDQLTEWREMFPDADAARLREIYNSALNAVG